MSMPMSMPLPMPLSVSTPFSTFSNSTFANCIGITVTSCGIYYPGSVARAPVPPGRLWSRSPKYVRPPRAVGKRRERRRWGSTWGRLSCEYNSGLPQYFKAGIRWYHLKQLWHICSGGQVPFLK
jgi:hypothetical protein